MMRWYPILASLLLGACGPVEPVDTDLTGTVPAGTPTPTETHPTYTDEGSIVLLVRHAEVEDLTERVAMFGIFADSIRDTHNFASCLAYRDDTYCATQLPLTPDTGVNVDPYDETVLGGIDARDIGSNVKLGSYQANGVEREGLWVYANQALAAFGPPVDGTLDLGFEGGEWGDYSAPDVIPAPDEMIVVLPDPTRRHTLANGTFELQWIPGLVGDVYLSVESETVKKLYLLEDDGQHFLDVDALGLTDLEEVKLTLGRWTQTVHDQYGNDIEILVQDEQTLRMQYRDLSSRTEIEGANSCAQALYSPELTSGQYFGRLSTNTNQLQPSGACGNLGSGPEQIFRTQLNDGGEVSLAYMIFSSDASLYLMTSCGDFGSCIDNSDVAGAGAIETLNWVNSLGGPTDVYIVLDARTGPVNDLYLMDVDIIDIEPSPLVDSCAEAIYQTPLTSSPPGTDRYVGNINTFHNYADPAASACYIAGPGQDGMVKVELLPGETLEATVEMPGANPVVYLLYNCALSVSCAAGSDLDATEVESVTYTNATGSTEVLYLVVDSQGGSGAFTLDLLIQ